MRVRCKMKLQSIEVFENSRKFKFTAVCDDGTPENKKFYNSSPSGEFIILVNNKDVFDAYEVGKYYYFDSMPVETAPMIAPNA